MRKTYLFLSNFDATSNIERKNPLGTVIAFQNAFPKKSERVGLIIKTRNLDGSLRDGDRAHWARTLERIHRDPRIRVIDYTMPEDALSGLYRMCDCFVSLHRSEGFGFGPAEAMAHGRPAIVTNYSGVCDFCTPTTAKLVGYQLVRVKDDEYAYLDKESAYEWADPDLKMAANYMRELAEDREQSQHLGRAAGGCYCSRVQPFGAAHPLRRPSSAIGLHGRYTDRCSFMLIDGHFESDYGLAIVNRCLTLALIRAGRPVQWHQYDRLPGPDFFAAYPELAAHFVSSVEQSSEQVHSRYIYPPDTSGMTGSVELCTAMDGRNRYSRGDMSMRSTEIWTSSQSCRAMSRTSSKTMT